MICMDISYRENVDIGAISSMKTGGKAKKAVFPSSEQELKDAVRELYRSGEKYYVLGNMSNVLIPEGELDFVPVVTTGVKGFSAEKGEDGRVHVYAGCGASLTKLAYEMCKKGYAGMQFAYGIPGSIGGAVYMNAGAYGSEISSVLEYADFYDAESDKVERLTNAQCDFGYRTSVFQSRNGVILGASFVLEEGDAELLMNEAKQTMQKRIDKQPLEYPSCGSAFKRPEGYFAGALIEECGLKGKNVGGAYVSEKHAGFIVNKGGATTDDVLGLISFVQKTVLEEKGVALEPEIRIIE